MHYAQGKVGHLRQTRLVQITLDASPRDPFPQHNLDLQVFLQHGANTVQHTAQCGTPTTLKDNSRDVYVATSRYGCSDSVYENPIKSATLQNSLVHDICSTSSISQFIREYGVTYSRGPIWPPDLRSYVGVMSHQVNGVGMLRPMNSVLIYIYIANLPCGSPGNIVGRSLWLRDSMRVQVRIPSYSMMRKQNASSIKRDCWRDYTLAYQVSRTHWEPLPVGH